MPRPPDAKPSSSTSSSHSPRRSPTKTPKRKSSVRKSKSPKQKKNERRRHVPRVLREIRFLRTTTHNLIPKANFGRLMREYISYFGELRIQLDALQALHIAAEMYLVDFFEDSYLTTIHANRKTLMPKDFRLLRSLRSRYENFD